jgi:hypothetical protein
MWISPALRQSERYARRRDLRHHLPAKVRTFIDPLAHHSAEHQKLINPYS